LRLLVDTHTHTISSGHSYSTIQENAREACTKGLEAIAMTDHGPAMKGAPSLIHFWNLKVIPERIYGVRIIKGVEANIIDYSGNTDVPDGALRQLEFAMASFHDITIVPASVEEHTQALVNALKNPFIDAIAHPGNPVFQVDIDRVVKTAAEYGKLIEINNHSFSVRKGSDVNCREFARKCRKYGARITCGSDAHISFDIGTFDRVRELLIEADIPEELIICTSGDKIERFVEERKAVKAKTGRRLKEAANP
jgi:putative hydrolase